MKGVILAAGKGRRLRPLTHTGPKHLLPIAGKPIINYGIEKLKEIGLKEIGIIVGYRAEDIKQYLKDGSQLGISIHYFLQEPQMGIAHALKFAEKYLSDDKFIVYLGDNLLKQDLMKFAEKFENDDLDALILLSKVRKPERFGVAVIENGKVTKLIEKPKERISDLALVGIYFFKPTIFKAIHKIKPSWRNELEITDAIQWLIDHNYAVEAEKVEGWWADTGSDIDLLEANYLILEDIEPYNKATIDENAKIIGKVQIEEGTEIKGNTTIRGPVYIGKNCIIENAAIQPFTSIESNCKIRNAEIEHSIILNNCMIDCKRRIVNSIIGKDSMIQDANKGAISGYKLVLGENSKVYI